MKLSYLDTETRRELLEHLGKSVTETQKDHEIRMRKIFGLNSLTLLRAEMGFGITELSRRKIMRGLRKLIK